jgi:hypothetical protein
VQNYIIVAGKNSEGTTFYKNVDNYPIIRPRSFLKTVFYKLDSDKSNAENVMILSLIMVEQIAFKYRAKMVKAPDNFSNKKNLPYGLTQIKSAN